MERVVFPKQIGTLSFRIVGNSAWYQQVSVTLEPGPDLDHVRLEVTSPRILGERVFGYGGIVPKKEPTTFDAAANVIIMHSPDNGVTWLESETRQVRGCCGPNIQFIAVESGDFSGRPIDRNYVVVFFWWPEECNVTESSENDLCRIIKLNYP